MRQSILSLFRVHRKKYCKADFISGHLKVIKLEGCTKISASHLVLADAYPYLVMLPLENISKTFVEKIKGELDRTLSQYAITTTNITAGTAQNLVVALQDHLKECQGVFNKRAQIKSWDGLVLIEGVNFLGQKEVVDYYLDKSDEMITSLLSLLSNKYHYETRASATKALGQIGAKLTFNGLTLQKVINSLCESLKDLKWIVRFYAASPWVK